MQVRECEISDFERIHFLNSKALGYECTYSDSLKNIMAIAVDETYRGIGIGKALICAVENWAKDCNCCGIRLVSGFDRTGAHEFYLKSGYTNRKQQKNFIKYLNYN